MALARAKKTERAAGGGTLQAGIAANAAILQGALLILAAGFARPGRVGQGANLGLQQADALTYRAAGVALESVTGSAVDGAVPVKFQEGRFKFKNSAAGDLITEADRGRPCYVVDDETVAKTSATQIRCVAGAVVQIDADGGVIVDVSLTNSAAM